MQKYSFAMLAGLMFSATCAAAAIVNPGFEEGWNGWSNSNQDGRSTGISSHHHSGKKSAKISSPAGAIGQTLAVIPNTHYQVTAQIKGAGILGVKVGSQLFFERQSKIGQWQPISLTFNSGAHQQITLFCQYNGRTGYFDDFALNAVTAGNHQPSASATLLTNGLSPDLAPGQNFKLNDWYLSTPENDGTGRSLRVSEQQLTAGYQHSDYFYTGKDGGMVMRATVAGSKTSSNTQYTRTELREMLRAGNLRIATKSENSTPNANNWVLSSAPAQTQKLAGGVDGTLRAKLAVNHVTTTGKEYQVGRVIIGQIHAKDDEPIRLYYRKLPNHKYGSIYAAHEISGGEDLWFPIIGSRANDALDPVDGISLNEIFSYTIEATGHLLTVSILRKGKPVRTQHIDMRESGYDVTNDYLYFKAGVYNQNNTGDPDDYVQATFYALENSHSHYKH